MESERKGKRKRRISIKEAIIIIRCEGWEPTSGCSLNSAGHHYYLYEGHKLRPKNVINLIPLQTLSSKLNFPTQFYLTHKTTITVTEKPPNCEINQMKENKDLVNGCNIVVIIL